MRAMRAGAAAVVCLALSAAWTTAVVAQELADPMAPASFTFTLEPAEESSNQHMPEVMRGHQEASSIESTDARASGLLTSIVNWNVAVSEDTGALSAAMSQRLTNDGGAWVGEGWGMLAGFDGSSRMARMTVLTGEGDYEGLTLVLSHAWDADGELGWGIIVPSDELPPMPEPVEPPTE